MADSRRTNSPDFDHLAKRRKHRRARVRRDNSNTAADIRDGLDELSDQAYSVLSSRAYVRAQVS